MDRLHIHSIICLILLLLMCGVIAMIAEKSNFTENADDSGGNFSIHTHASNPIVNPYSEDPKENYIYDYDNTGSETENNFVNADDVRKCICSSRQGGREENCQNKEVVTKLYLDGDLTEFTDIERKGSGGIGGWSTTSPGDLGFPLDTGCTGCNKGAGGRPWSFWDYTNF